MKAIHKRLRTTVDAFCVRDLIADASRNWRNLPERIRKVYESGDLIFLPESIRMNSSCAGWRTVEADDYLVLWPSGVLGVFPRGSFELECELLH